ncbi:MAG: nucleotidyltransferase family protein [Lachnospiraceae bacterium]|nr:nucleotidyltransferase family protein [Lachnospiraceae bacterium]
MGVTGIIAEYNPLHLGHRHLLEEVRKGRPEQGILVVMSGDFVQRGEPALTDKYRRAAMALEAGADLVIELPPRFATASAAGFARGAVGLLQACGCVDELAFGASCEDPAVFKGLADRTRAALGTRIMHDGLREGLSYAAAAAAAVSAEDPEAGSLLRDPNNLLGTENVMMIRELGAEFRPVPVLRTGEGHLSRELPEQGFASATAVRRALERGETAESLRAYLAPGVPEKLDYTIFPDDLSAAMSAVLWRLMQDGDEAPAALIRYADVGGILAVRIADQAPFDRPFTELAEAVSSRNFTLARVRRSLLHILLGIRREDMTPLPRSIRILGLREDSFLPALLKEKASLPVLTKMADADPALAEEYTQAHRLYAQTVYFKTGRRIPDDYRQSPVVLKRENDCILF